MGSFTEECLLGEECCSANPRFGMALLAGTEVKAAQAGTDFPLQLEALSWSEFRRHPKSWEIPNPSNSVRFTELGQQQFLVNSGQKIQWFLCPLFQRKIILTVFKTWF